VTGDDTSHEHTPAGQFAAAIQLQWPQEKEMTVLTDWSVRESCPRIWTI
jgi:hypothetical protein